MRQMKINATLGDSDLCGTTLVLEVAGTSQWTRCPYETKRNEQSTRWCFDCMLGRTVEIG